MERTKDSTSRQPRWAQGLLIGALILGLVLPVTSCKSTQEKRPPQFAQGAGGPPDGQSGPGGPGGQGGNPPGPPPDGKGTQGGPGVPLEMGGGSQQGPSSFAGAFLQKGKVQLVSGRKYSTQAEDTSGIVVTDGGSLMGSDIEVQTSGSSSSPQDSSFYGLDAGILALKGSSIRLERVTVSTTGTGANGIFANGDGSFVYAEGGSVTAIGGGGHAIMASRGGAIIARDLVMNTSGANSGAIATDRGGGTILVTGGSVVTSGPDSPGIYSTGTIAVRDAKIAASGSEAAVIEGANSISLENVDLSSSKEGKWGVMVYQSMSGDASGNGGRFTMLGGRLAYTSRNGPLFYVTNTTAVVSLSMVDVETSSGILLKAEAGRWGKSGTNGGHALVVLSRQSLSGDMSADGLSTIDLMLEAGSRWTGSMNAARSAKSVSVRLDASSAWTLTADSYITTLYLPDGMAAASISCIDSQGHNLYYKASENHALDGKTYELPGGGSLKPY